MLDVFKHIKLAEAMGQEVNSFKDELDYIKTILKDDKEVELFIFDRAMKRLGNCMPNDISLDGYDFSYNAAQSIDNLTKAIVEK
jgi:hypothetical protein